MNKDDYHEDSDTRILGERYAGIVVKDHQILLVHRIKDGYEYYVFPGGHRRPEESGPEAAIREVYEETGITVGDPRPAFKFKDFLTTNSDYYYLCIWKEGTQPHLIGEEVNADSKVDFFDPRWVDLKEVENLNILPKFAKYWLLDYLEKK